MSKAGEWAIGRAWNPYGTYAGRASSVGMIRSAVVQVLLLQDSHKQVSIFLKPEVKHSVILTANFHRHVPTVHCLTSQITSPIPEGVPDYIAGPIMCSTSTVYRSLVESGLKAGNWVVFPSKWELKPSLTLKKSRIQRQG